MSDEGRLVSIQERVELTAEALALFDKFPVPAVFLDETNAILQMNEAAVDLFGPSESKGQMLQLQFDVFLPKLQASGEQSNKTFSEIRKISLAAGSHRRELRLKNLTGGEFCAELDFRLFQYEGRDLLLVAIDDLSSIKKVEEKLEEQRRRVESIMNNAPGVFYRCQVDSHWTMNFVSSDVKNLTGYPASDFLENSVRSFADIIHSDDLEAMSQAVEEAIQNLRPYEVRLRMTYKGGRTRTVLNRGVAEYDFDSGEVKWLDGFLLDITEEVIREEETQRLESELSKQRLNSIQSSKMASLGEMAGGVAHEINNPLAIIEGFASRLVRLASKGPVSPEDVLKSTNKIQTTVERIARIVRGLRNFSRDGGEDPVEKVVLAEIFQETLDFCRERFRQENIEVELDLENSLLELPCRRVQISQVFINLLNNSFDAIRGDESPWIRVKVREHRDFVEILVTDSGKGIPLETQELIMQPFFTTKDVGEGSGLGLGICKGIVESHGGELYYDPKEERTTFHISLPKI